MKHDLIDGLVKRARIVSLVSDQICYLVARNGSIPCAKATVMSLETEFRACVEEWEYSSKRLDEHKAEHGC